MSEFIIEDGIPMPENTNRGRKSMYPWRDMEVGQSFFVPNPPKDVRGYWIPMASAASKRNKPKKFEQRSE